MDRARTRETLPKLCIILQLCFIEGESSRSVGKFNSPLLPVCSVSVYCHSDIFINCSSLSEVKKTTLKREREKFPMEQNNRVLCILV